MEDPDLADLFDRAVRADEAAWRELHARFGPELRTMVRHRLPRVLRPQYDSMDFVQSIWRSVFEKCRGELPQFENAKHFLGYLAGMAANRVIYEHRRRTRTRKYDLSRQEPLYFRRGDREVLREVAGNDPTPSQDVQARDQLDQIMDGLDDVERKVVELRLGDYTIDEIAALLGISESAVRRILTPLRKEVEARERRVEAREWP
jgi:RNA polymerase sigma-70 factor (ECF subfamily)